jgi:hypothetical protein
MDDRQTIKLIRRKLGHFEGVKSLLDELPKLRDAAKTLAALEAAGVDNWEGYSYAQELMEE